MERLLHYLRVLQEYAKDYVLENTGLKILALIITALLWLSVASRPVSQVTLRDVTIEFRNLPGSPLLDIVKHDPMTASVYLEGSRDLLDAVRPSDISVFADMSGVEAGMRVKELQVDTGRLPTGVKVRGWEPTRVRAIIERVVESGDLPVIPNIVGGPPPGYTYTYNISPATVRVVGPESIVTKLESVSTETVNLAGLTDTFTKRVAIDIGVPDVPTLTLSNQSSRDISLTVIIGKERTFENVPVAVFGAPPGMTAVPRFIKVVLFGEGSAIDSMTINDVGAAVEYQGEQGNNSGLTPRVSISPQFSGRVTVRSFEPESVRIR